MAVSTAFSLTGFQKLGHPVPDSNLVLASKSLAPQQTQRNVPLKWPLEYLPEKAGSVAFIRVTMNCSTVSRLRHSSLVLKIRSGSLTAFLESFGRDGLVIGSRRLCERILRLDRRSRGKDADHSCQQENDAMA